TTSHGSLGVASVTYFWLGLALTLTLPALLLGFLVWLHWHLRWFYLHFMERGFQEKPLFIIPWGQPIADAEEVSFKTPDRLTLKGCYFRSLQPRRGVILFGLEYGSNRWACPPYCDHLRAAGFDVFTYEPRNQGDSDRQPTYEPLQWLTEYEVRDAHAAVAYLKSRSDADARGIGLFGISKGGCAGIMAAAGDPYIRCIAVDGIYATYTV